jgi:hypothetical protein
VVSVCGPAMDRKGDTAAIATRKKENMMLWLLVLRKQVFRLSENNQYKLVSPRHDIKKPALERAGVVFIVCLLIAVEV